MLSSPLLAHYVANSSSTVIPPSPHFPWQQRANILKEVQIMRGLNHPGIVRLLNFTESSNHYYLTLEYVQPALSTSSGPAADVTFSSQVDGRRRAVPPNCQAYLLLGRALATCHSASRARDPIFARGEGCRPSVSSSGLLSRLLGPGPDATPSRSDIKPENILFEGISIIPSKVPRARPYDEEKEDEGEFIPGIGGGGIGRVKIADFGLSKIVWNEETMTPCGTVGYTAPEIVKDERYSKSVDMWALGCVLYTLLCGFPPFYDESIHVLTEKVAKGYYTFLSPWWDDISASCTLPFS